ncbi:alpha/beta fold hydrolase [Nocardiopsis deserti]|uniref:alpha/beta fold hydrolase n=1 Tax=Nocardiopsis deserti TaxID=2605988 RepID=UPI00123B3445|nr:alpha/beta hydrolase [Nocardiopsis deserti]
MNLQQFNSHRSTVRTRSGEISYVDVGEGPVALFVHGLGTNGYLWRNVLAELADERRCIAVDLPLHGQSPVVPGQELTLRSLAVVLEDFCAAMELDAVDMVSNDTGGAVVQIFAVDHPERLTTLTLTNCETHDNLPNEAFRGTVELARKGELAPRVAMMLDNLDVARSPHSLGSNYERPDELTEETVRTFLEPIASTPERTRHFERLLASLDPGDLLGIEPKLREFTVPTLVVWATDDVHFELKWAYWLRDTVPGVTEVVEIEGAKLHFPVERAPELATHLRRHWSVSRAGDGPASG